MFPGIKLRVLMCWDYGRLQTACAEVLVRPSYWSGRGWEDPGIKLRVLMWWGPLQASLVLMSVGPVRGVPRHQTACVDVLGLGRLQTPCAEVLVRPDHIISTSRVADGGP